MIGWNLRALNIGALLLLSCCALNAVVSHAQAAPATAGAMQGTVIIAGEGDQTPAPGATIAVFSEGCVGSTASDNQGKFNLSGLAPGIYLLEARYLIEARYLTLRAQQNIKISAGETAQVAVQLKSPDPTHPDQ